MLTAQHTDDGVEKKRRFLSASIMMMVIITVMLAAAMDGSADILEQCSAVECSAVKVDPPIIISSASRNGASAH